MRICIALLGLALALAIFGTRSADAQLVVVTEKYTVTELRPDKQKIGVGIGDTGTTRNWVEIERRTRVSTGGVLISHNQLWQRLKRGTVIKVHGGRDFDQHVIAKQIWF